MEEGKDERGEKGKRRERGEKGKRRERGRRERTRGGIKGNERGG